MRNNWAAPTTLDEASRRAGGRRAYNSWRAAIRDLRRLQVVRLLHRYVLGQWGTVRAIARELGVSPATACRDIKALLRQFGRCPHCRQLLSPESSGASDECSIDAGEVLDDCQAEFEAGEWQWAGRGPLPREAKGGP